MKSAIFFGLTLVGLNATATPYVLTITNGSKMPLSPGIAYVVDGQSSRAQVGQAATPGFVHLCQMGDPALRTQELSQDPHVKNTVSLAGPLMPGQSVTVEVNVPDIATQSVQFETMYGKTKDTCATGGVNSHSLRALREHVTTAIEGKDNALQTGAFTDPALPMGQTYLSANICQATDSIGCLRELAMPTSGTIRSFSPYLSSVIMALENKFGASEVLPLIFSDAGAVRFELKLKH